MADSLWLPSARRFSLALVILTIQREPHTCSAKQLNGITKAIGKVTYLAYSSL